MRLFSAFLLFFTILSHSQQTEAFSSVVVDADVFVGYDKFGFMYFIDNNTLHKTNGTELLQYQNLRLGKIKSVDLNNPLKLILLYQDFNTVVMLDNQLNEISSIDFSKLTTPIVVNAAGNASQNRLWFYDGLSQKIGLFDYSNSSYLFVTQPLIGNLTHWETDFNTFQWIDGGKRYAVDLYGKVSDLGKVPDFDSVRFTSDSGLIYEKDGIFYLFKRNQEPRKLLESDPKSFQSFWYKDQILAIFTTRLITNYKITTP